MFCETFPGQAPNTTLENDERVWDRGYDSFLRATQDKVLLEHSLPLLQLPSFKPVLDAKKEFWMAALDALPDALLKACTFCENYDEGVATLDDLLRMYHSGVVFLLMHLPSQVFAVGAKTCNALRDAIDGDAFWTYNPLLLVSTCLWATSLHDKADEVLETHLPLSADSLAESIPFLERPDIKESDVSSQEAAQDFVQNAMSMQREPASLLNMLFSAVLPPLVLDSFLPGNL